MLSERRQAKKECPLYEFIGIKFQEMQTNVQRSGQGLPEEAGGDQKGGRKEFSRGTRKLCGGDRCNCCLDCGDGFTNVKRSKLC